MFSVNKYLDSLTEMDSDGIGKLIKKDFGFYRFITPIYWDFSKKRRQPVLAYTLFLFSGLFLFLLSCICLACQYQNMMLATRGAVQGSFALVAIAPFITFMKYRRSITCIYGLIAGGFGRYGDFPKGVEDSFYKKMDAYKIKLKKAWLVIFCFITVFYCLYDKAEAVIVPSEELIFTEGVNKKFPIPIWLPFDSEPSIIFYPTFIVLLYLSASTGFGIMVLSYAFVIFGQRIINQIERLIYAIEHLEERSICQWKRIASSSKKNGNLNELYTNRQFLTVHKMCLRQTIVHHQLIIKSVREYEKLFGLTNFIMVSMGSMMVALSLVGVMDESSSFFYKMFSLLIGCTELITFYLICFIGERISEKLGDVRIAIYNTRWPDFTEDAKKTVRIVQEITLKPLKIRETVFGVQLDLNLFSNIVNTGYSYANLIYMFRK